jgi:LysM repeat protein
MLRRLFLTVFSLLCTVAIVHAQATECPAAVETALKSVADLCHPLSRNAACYGAKTVDSVTFDNPRPANFFAAPGDRSELLKLREIHPQPLNMTDNSFGVALLNVQANIPNTLPGQAVIFMLMGDAKLTNEVPVDSKQQSAFQSFYFLPGPGKKDCYEAEPILTIQTPGNITVNMMFNGVDTEFSPGTLLTITPSVCTIHRGNIIQRVGTDQASLLANQTVDIHIEPDGKVLVDDLRDISKAEYQRGLDLQSTLNQVAVANGWGEQLITPPRAYGQEPNSTTTSEATAESPEATAVPTAAANEQSICVEKHTVLRGDTLRKIAERYHTTIQAIVDANKITNPNLILPGQILCIPGPASG